MTPEGKVKAKLTKMLSEFKPHVWQYAAVETGFGTRAVDKLTCVCGFFVAIECKADITKKLTARQELTKKQITEAGGLFFEVYDDHTLRSLQVWIQQRVNGRIHATNQ